MKSSKLCDRQRPNTSTLLRYTISEPDQVGVKEMTLHSAHQQM